MIKYKTFIKLFFVIIYFTTFNSYGQNIQNFDNQINQIIIGFNNIKNYTSETEIKYKANIIDSLFQVMLSDESCFNNDFSSLKNYCSVLESDDKKLRIITWNTYFNSTGEHFYYGYIQHFNNDDMFNFFVLKDDSENITNPELVDLNANKWFGCIYYEIITQKVKKKTYYTLLGWDGNNVLTNKKLIDVLSFSFDKPKFGYSFNIDGLPKKRLIFEYSEQATMSLNWNAKMKMIIWDHLSPAEPKYTGMFQYYGPDFTNDGLVFKKKKWEFVEDVIVNNAD